MKQLCRRHSVNFKNKAFLEPLEEYRLSCSFTHLALEKDSPMYANSSQISPPLDRLAQTRF